MCRDTHKQTAFQNKFLWQRLKKEDFRSSGWILVSLECHFFKRSSVHVWRAASITSIRLENWNSTDPIITNSKNTNTIYFKFLKRARMGEGGGLQRVLVGKPEGKRPLGRPRRRSEDNIKMDLQEVGWGCGDWMELAQDKDRWRALVSMVMNFRVP